MTFYVGQKVVCVDGAPAPGDSGTFPREGSIYTVRWAGVYEHPFGVQPTMLAVHLSEIERPIHPAMNHPVPYRATRFRPLVERKTDISVFTKLTPSEREKELIPSFADPPFAIPPDGGRG